MDHRIPLVVLVRTHSPGNLGGAARAILNFGGRLLLLEPATEPTHPDALAFASGAENLLAEVEVLPSWVALEERAGLLVALTSPRGRGARGLPPALEWSAFRSGRAGPRPVAFVFGPERSGLTTDELRRCGARLSIPTSPEFPTLNLAQAVAVTLALAAPRRRAEAANESRASAVEMARLRETLRSALAESGFQKAGKPDAVLTEIEAVLLRASPSRREAELLISAISSLRRTP